ncbi:MAG: hypothetical protein R2857_03810 [Vampirovibrionales bacterium]
MGQAQVRTESVRKACLAGKTAKGLRLAGKTAKGLRLARKSIKRLPLAGKTAKSLRLAGKTVKRLRLAGKSIKRLRLAGKSGKLLRLAGKPLNACAWPGNPLNAWAWGLLKSPRISSLNRVRINTRQIVQEPIHILANARRQVLRAGQPLETTKHLGRWRPRLAISLLAISLRTINLGRATGAPFVRKMKS